MTVMEFAWDTPLMILAVVVVAVLLDLIGSWVIRRTVKRLRKIATKPKGTLSQKAAKALKGSSTDQRQSRTLAHTTAVAHLLRSVWTIVLVVVAILTILSIVNIPLAPVLTSAGVGGVIVAFGAQSLIKDYFTGISMILEDQFGVGDQVTIGDVSGIVEDVTLRITKLRDGSGTIWYIRNGEILKVGNVTQGYSTGFVDVPVAVNADVAEVTQVLTDVLAKAADDDDMSEKLIEPPQLLGVESVTASALTMRIMVKTGPNQQHALVRAIREQALAALTEAGIPGPTALPPIIPPPQA